MLHCYLKVNRCSRGTCYFNLQSWRVWQARNQHETGSKHTSPCCSVTCSYETMAKF
jgi:hypothetical protein